MRIWAGGAILALEDGHGRLTDKRRRWPDPSRPLLIGMVNPLSVNPNMALWPQPPGCTGHRLWRLLWARTGVGRDDYLEAFGRVNMCTDRVWDVQAARLAVPDLKLRAQGRRVVLLGAACADLWGIEPDHLRWQGDAAYMPHPSGRSRWYNETVSRLAAEVFMEELYLSTSYAQRRQVMLSTPALADVEQQDAAD